MDRSQRELCAQERELECPVISMACMHATPHGSRSCSVPSTRAWRPRDESLTTRTTTVDAERTCKTARRYANAEDLSAVLILNMTFDRG